MPYKPERVYNLNLDTLPRHRCVIYEGSPSVHLPIVASAIMERLQANCRCLYLNSRPMIAGLRSCLAASGLDVVGSVARKSLILSAEQDPSAHGVFDIDTMLANLERLAQEAIADGYAGLFATGDMLWEFGSERNLNKLLEYEMRLEELLARQPSLSGICQYHRDILPPRAIRAALYTHQSVYRNETLARINPHYGLPGTLAAGPASAHRDVSEMLAELD